MKLPGHGICVFWGCVALRAASTSLARGGATSSTGISSFRRSLGSKLDAISLVGNIKDSSLDVVVNLASSANEGFLDVLSGLGRSLNKNESMLISEGLALFSAHGTAVRERKRE